MRDRTLIFYVAASLAAAIAMFAGKAKAEPCTGIPKTQAIEMTAPYGVEKLIELNEADVNIIKAYLLEKYPNSPGDMPDVKTAIHILFVDGTGAVGLFDKDGLMCSSAVITKDLFIEYEKVLEKSKV